MIGAAVRVLAAVAAVLVSFTVSGSAASLGLGSQPLTPYRTCVITATPATSVAVQDATVQQGAAASNFGSAPTISASTSNNANQRIYLRFDLGACSPAIPASATVRLATLRLYLTTIPGVCRALDLFRVTASWAEATITWNNQPFGTALNNPASGSRSGTFSVGPAGCQNPATGAYVIGGTLTSDVAAFVAGSATNIGWMIRDDAEGTSPARTATFTAKELGSVAQEPQLVITYVTVP